MFLGKQILYHTPLFAYTALHCNINERIQNCHSCKCPSVNTQPSLSGTNTKQNSRGIVPATKIYQTQGDQRFAFHPEEERNSQT
jgi:hypothetical protein